MEHAVIIEETKSIVESLHNCQQNERMLSHMLPKLKKNYHLMDELFNELIRTKKSFSPSEINNINETAKLFSLISASLLEKPTSTRMTTALLCKDFEDLCWSISFQVQSIIDPTKGFFYYSENNIKELVTASKNALKLVDTSKEIEFVEIT